MLSDSEWRAYAACRFVDLDFFPKLTKGKQQTSKTLKITRQRSEAVEQLRVCQSCTVREQCKIEHKHEPEGIYFNTVPTERTTNPRRREQCNCLACRYRKRLGNQLRSERLLDERRKEQLRKRDEQRGREAG